MSKRSKNHDDATPDLFADLGDESGADNEVGIGHEAGISDAPGKSEPARPEKPHAALHDTQALFALLDRWVERGWLRALDRALASFFQREVSNAPPLLLLATALASHQLGRGHVCLDLAQTLGAPNLALSLPPEGDDLSDPPPLPSDLLAGLELATWRDALNHPALVADGSGPGNTPLVRSERDGNVRLYLRRYWQYEQDIRHHISARLGTSDDILPSSTSDEICRRKLQLTTGTDRRPDDALPSSTSDEICRRKLQLTTGADRRPDNALPANTSDEICRRKLQLTTGADRRPDNATDTNRFATALDSLFPSSADIDWQKIACALAAQAHFAVITGGPGTGKTTTVVKLLALLQALALGEPATNQAPRPLRIRLAAPTGKAAARLNESIAKQVQGLSLVELASAVGQQGVDISILRDSIPTEVTTLHRLLGSRPDTRHFRHHAGNPLALDALVIDEASMVDIEMMAAVLTALPPRARLILLGDKDQLASVEAGAVLGDLCQRAEGGHYSPATCDWLERVVGTPIPEQYRDEAGQPLDQAIAMLRVSHRFDSASGIGQLAEAVNRPLSSNHGQKEKKRAVREIFQQGYADIARLALADADDPALDRLVVNGNPAGFANNGEGRYDRRGETIAPPVGYRHYLEVMKAARPAQPFFGEGEARQPYDNWARQLLATHGHFQLLCALRKGPWGIEGLNPRIGRALRRAGWLKASDLELEQGWFEGRPVLVTRNDYGLGLMNGDIGITLAVPEARSASESPGRTLLRVAFPASDGSGDIKWVLPSRLQAVETVFAMTVHKSQGSEFTHTALLLPDAPNPILTRELVYTGITRAKHWLTLVETGRGMLDEAVMREVVRVSGLGRLW
ncbi:exodeoxyribonuclease V subunit alpha [Billgrantia montanilacus]|uniref:RecBCD enzyme subunit RecD n=1 Tax=Billgrantia montanilacus TaxID=2282305 RepID=A0A368TT95_9GAMM|nr:exodeoxyribonuclease V subunit alpha [Halomonas montanilacus]RCV87999.1 exodeoxyribonuclease V subunit alpha [Halomonas montanilacus]